MQPYVIRSGDHLLQLAHDMGFDADIVWNDPANNELRKLRPDPNILFAGDVLYVPDPAASAVTYRLTTGSTNTFTTLAPPTMTLTHKFVGRDKTAYASKAFTVQEVPDLAGLTTDDDGVATITVPVNLPSVTVVFAASGETSLLGVGDMDPIDTVSGVFKRLANLGAISPYIAFDSLGSLERIRILRAGLLALKAARGSPDDDDGAGLDDSGMLDDDTTTLLRNTYGC